jgi:hypothetical protein
MGADKSNKTIAHTSNHLFHPHKPVIVPPVHVPEKHKQATISIFNKVEINPVDNKLEKIDALIKSNSRTEEKKKEDNCVSCFSALIRCIRG